MDTLGSRFVMTESTWEDTYARSFPQIFRGLIMLGARPDEAEDALHDAFVKGLDLGETDSPVGWLYVAASRRWQRRRLRERLLRPFIRGPNLLPPAAADRIELLVAVRRLPSRQREVLVERYILGLEQIAAGTTEAAEALRALTGERSLSETLEPWTVRQFADATARIALPPRDRWVPQTRARTRTKPAALLALVTLVLVGLVLVFAAPTRTGVVEPSTTPSPTFSRNDSGTPLPAEAEVWGEIWSEAKGIAVLRPTWLPKSAAEYQVFSVVHTSPGGLLSYDVSYTELHSVSIVWNVEFFADLETEGRGFVQFGGVPETVTIRGHAAELTGTGSPGWVLVWSEGDYRYAIQAFAVSREDLIRIADSLRPVIDDAGNTR